MKKHSPSDINFKHKPFIPLAYYKRKIRYYCGQEVRIYRDFLKFIDFSIKTQNKELLKKILILKKKKTLTKEDLLIFIDIVRIYDPRPVLSSENGSFNFKNRIKKLLVQEQIRATKDSWGFISQLLHQKIDHLSTVLEKYLITSKRRTLHCNDISKIFEDNRYFLI